MSFADKSFNHKHLSQIKCLEGAMKERTVLKKASGFYEDSYDDELYAYSSLSAGDNLLIPICKGVKQYIKTFEEELDDEHEIGVLLGGFGSVVQIHLHSIGYTAPELITLHGVTLEGESIQLVQVISQFNVLFKAVRKKGDIARRVIFLGN